MKVFGVVAPTGVEHGAALAELVRVVYERTRGWSGQWRRGIRGQAEQRAEPW